MTGAVWIEALLVLPLLALLVLSLADGYFYFDSELEFTQAAREAILTGAAGVPLATTLVSVPSGSMDESTRLSVYTNCYEGAVTSYGGVLCGHWLIDWRVRKLLESHRPALEPATLLIQSGGAGSSVSVKVTARFRSRFARWFDFNLFALVTGGRRGR